MDRLQPVVRYLIACDEILFDPLQPRKVTLVNVMSAIRSLGDPAYPLRHREICIFVQLTDCRAKGADIRVDLVQADTGQVIFQTRTRSVAFGADPLEIYGITFQLRGCVFPLPGLYWIQFVCNDEMIAQHPLLLR